MIWALITIIVFYLASIFHKKFSNPITIPIITVTVVLILLLSVLGISHEEYVENGGKWISMLLNAAVVSLAIPLYKQRKILLKNFIPIIVGSISGILILIVFQLFVGSMLQLDKELIISTLPQLATTPIAVSISEQMGGIPSLTSAFVVVAGMVGAIFGPFFMKLFHVTSAVGKGVGLGCASHIIGVSRLIKEGNDEATIGSVTMILTGILASIIIPLGLMIFY